MNLESITLLYQYNIWANNRILEQTAQLTIEQFITPQPYLGEPPRSLRSVLVHTLSGEWLWRNRVMLGISPSSLLSEEEFPNVGELQQRWYDEGETMRYYIAGLTSARLQEPITYTTTRGLKYTSPCWQLISHVVLHGMQHRSEAALVLTNYGFSPGDIDFIAFIREL